jgi:hypothetical protein
MEDLSCKIRSVDQASADITTLCCVALRLILTYMHVCKMTYSLTQRTSFYSGFYVPGIGVDVNGPCIFKGPLLA